MMRPSAGCDKGFANLQIGARLVVGKNFGSLVRLERTICHSPDVNSNQYERKVELCSEK